MVEEVGSPCPSCGKPKGEAHDSERCLCDAGAKEMEETGTTIGVNLETAIGDSSPVYSPVFSTNLEDYVKERGGIDAVEALPLFLQIAREVASAHKRNLLHHDLKSANVLFDPRSSMIKVIDFGVAQTSKANSLSLATVGGQSLTIVGSPYYMSPDQISGRPYDARSEVYSLGCIMFETLCAVVPFKGDTAMSTLSLQANADIPRLSQKAGREINCPRALEDTIRKCLAKNPDERFGSVHELAEHLARIAGIESDHSLFDDAKAAELKNKYSRFSPVSVVLAPTLFAILIFMAYAGFVLTNTSKTALEEAKHSNPADQANSTSDSSAFDGFRSKKMKIEFFEDTGRLSISGLGFADPILERATRLRSPVREVELNNCKISKDGFKTLASMKELHSVSLLSLQMDSDPGWDDIAKLDKLERLLLIDVPVTDSLLSKISRLEKLQRVEIEHASNLTPNGLMGLIPLHLRYLSLKSTPLTEKHLLMVNEMNYLNELYLGNTGISDEGLRTLTGLKEIRILGLNGNPLSHNALGHLRDYFPYLATVFCAHCPAIDKESIENFQRDKIDCKVVTSDAPEIKEYLLIN